MMIFDVCNMRDKVSVSLLMVWTCRVGQLFWKSLLPEPKIDCLGQSGNLNVAPCVQHNKVAAECPEHTLSATPTCRSHSGSVIYIYDTFLAGQRNLDVLLKGQQTYTGWVKKKKNIKKTSIIGSRGYF